MTVNRLPYTVSQKKLCQCYFVNNSVKHWPNLIIFGTQHRDETWHKRPYSFADLTLILLLHYLVKWKSRILDVYNNEFMHRMPAQKIIVKPENHWKSVTSLTLMRSKSIVPRSWTSTNSNDAPATSGPLWVTWLLNVLMANGIKVYAVAFVLEADILSTYCNKDDMRWHVWLFLRDNNCQSCYCLLPFS